ncbi:MAG: hypothetical protein RLZZ501_65 [Pseudomonadota bacterium]
MDGQRIGATDVSLAALGKGAAAEIIALDEAAAAIALGAGELERRLIEMGLVEGARVEVLHEGFPRRDPIAVRVGDHTIALRRSEANAVRVRCLETLADARR